MKYIALVLVAATSAAFARPNDVQTDLHGRSAFVEPFADVDSAGLRRRGLKRRGIINGQMVEGMQNLYRNGVKAFTNQGPTKNAAREERKKKWLAESKGKEQEIQATIDRQLHTNRALLKKLGGLNSPESRMQFTEEKIKLRQQLRGAREKQSMIENGWNPEKEKKEKPLPKAATAKAGPTSENGGGLEKAEPWRESAGAKDEAKYEAYRTDAAQRRKARAELPARWN